jgi:hypothetical protein
MADDEKKSQSSNINDDRFKYIGFDVFPGKAGNMFKSDDERKSLIEKVKAKLSRSQGEVRDRCTLMESRVSLIEKIFLTIAAVVMVLGLFVPWFSGYIPISYEEVGTYGDQTLYFVSQSDEAAVNDLVAALKFKHDRRYNRLQKAAASQGHGDQEEPAMEEAIPPPVEEAEAGAEENPTVADDPPQDQIEITDTVAASADQEGMEPDTVISSAEEDQSMGEAAIEEEQKPLSEEIRVIFVAHPQVDQIHGVSDLREHLVATYSYNARTGQEQLAYGSANAFRALPDDMIMLAQTNDSIATAVNDSIRQVTEERIAAGDSLVSQDSITYAGPILITDKPLRDLAVRGVVNDYYSITGIGAILALGTYGSMIFSGGFILTITAILLIIYFISCLALAGLNLYLLYGAKKKTADENILYLKKMLRLNWIPVLLWLFMLLISFIGASYGFDSTGMLKQVGSSYGIATFIGLSSFGIYITLCAFLIAALKGKEI